MSSSKRPASAPEPHDVPFLNKRQRRPGDEPDVVVVVGGEEFQESSRQLRSFSDYFDAAFRSGMKEAQEMRFEFPDKNPREWGLVREWLKPFSKLPATKQYLKIALSWFDQLIVPVGLERCDELLSKFFIPRDLPLLTEGRTPNNYPKLNELDSILEYFDLAVQYNLPASLERCIEKIIRFFEKFPSSLNECHLQRIPSIMEVANEDNRKKFSTFLNHYLPLSLKVEDQQDALLSNSLLGHMLHARIQLGIREEQLGAVAGIMEDADPETAVRGLKKTLRKDRVCGEWFQSSN